MGGVGDVNAFPFSAVVGQDDARLALILAAIDPTIGGVLLRGDKGSAKTTLARGLAALLPEAPFVDLPIGATEDRVVGGLDVGAALSGEGVSLRAGLLAASHGGILYVDEVNLLPDHLVDVLLDAAASGVHRVERDGLSHTHPARFVLIGSMNPEEGELRPQLLDRFGLAVEVRAPGDAAVRADAVVRRLAYERGEQPANDDGALLGRLGGVLARPAATLPGAVIAFACRLALAAGAEGLRADLVLCRAAAALAAWEGRDETGVADIERVAPLALAHRRRRRPFDPPTFPPDELRQALDQARDQPAPSPGLSGPASGSPGPSPDSPDSPGSSGGGGAGSGSASATGIGSGSGGSTPAEGSGSGDGGSGGEAAGGRWSDLAGAALAALPTPVPAVKTVGSPAGVRPVVGPHARGPVVGDRRPGPGGPAGVAVAASVRARALRTAADPAASPGVQRHDLREPVRRQARRGCVVLVVDTSGSMGTQTRIEAATGAVLRLLATAYRDRQRVALVAFGGSDAQVALRPTASVEVARARLADLPTGGATPLAEGLRVGLDLARAARAAGDEPLLVVLTDGRATAAGDARTRPLAAGGGDARTRSLAAAEEIAGQAVRALVLDAEDGPVRLGLAARLAEAMVAPVVPVHQVSALDVTSAIAAHLVSRR